MVAKSTPALSRWIAVVCRRECGWIRLPFNVGAAVVPAVTYFAGDIERRICHYGAALVEEDRLIGRIFQAGMLLLDQIPQQLGRPRPDGTNADLVAFAGKADLEG